MQPRLPLHRHVPGTGSVPDRVALDPIKVLTPPQVTGDNWHMVPAYPYGVLLYGHAFFWEAHEVWEPVWLGTAPNSQERRFLAGLIQLTNACLKLEMDQPRAALRLLQATRDHLAECRGAPGLTLMGLDLGMLTHDTAVFAAKVGGRSHDDDRASLVAQRPRLTITAPHSTGMD